MSSLSFSLRDSRASETRTHVNIIQREKGEKRRGEKKKWGTTDKAQAVMFFSPRRVSPFSSAGDFHTRSRFARSTIPEGGKTTPLVPKVLFPGKTRDAHSLQFL